MTLVSVTQDVRDPLGLHVNQKYLKSGKKRLSFGQFTIGRLRDSSEYHTGCMGSIRASFEPKRSKIGLKMAEYYQTNWPKRCCVRLLGISENVLDGLAAFGGL